MNRGTSAWAILVAFLLCSPWLDARADGGADTLEGTWRGTLAGRLRLVLTVRRTAGGEREGTLDSVDQGAKLTVNSITTDGSRVVLEVRRVDGRYEGTLDKTATQLQGLWAQGGLKQPLTFVKDAPVAAAEPAAPAGGPAAVEAPVADAPIDVAIPLPPTGFRASGKVHLVYELHVTNFSPRPLVLTRVEAWAAAGRSALVRHEAADLAARTVRADVEDDEDASAAAKALDLGAGMRAVVFLWITLDGAEPPPTALEHVVAVKTVGGKREHTARGARVLVGIEPPVIIGPPLRGGDWIAANGPSNTSGHRRALMAVGGSAVIAQRFAIDWVRAARDGKTFTGDARDNKNYRAYGAEVLAVADGVVAHIKDGIPQNIPGPDSRAVPITMDTIGGNVVVVDIGRGRFALFAHLQPGSLRVKVGDAVKRGQVLGLLGNSGNSTEPHLHFHVINGSMPLGSEGLPYSIDSFELLPEKKAGPAQRRQNELPTEDQRIRFP